MHSLVTIATGKRYLFTRVGFSQKLPFFKAKKQKKAATLKEFIYIFINNGLYHTSSKNKKNLTLLLVMLYLRLKYLNFSSFFIRPSSDRTYYGMVMSVRPGLRPSVRLSVRPSVRHSFPHFSPICFDILIWNFVYHFNFMHVRSSSNAINFRHFLQELCSFLTSVKLLQICSFPHFSPTCFDILSSNFVYDFVLMYHRASLNVVILLQFLLELCLFVNLEYLKYTVFRTFLLHAFTHWAEILHMTLFHCTTDQVWVSSICVNFCGSYVPFGT